MGIKKLKKENEILNLNLANMLERFDTSKTKKYSQFLVKMLNKRIESWQKEQDECGLFRKQETTQNPLERIIPNSSFENMLSRMIFCESIFTWGNMERFVEFTELMEKGVISEKDISKYDSWDMLETQLYEAKNRELFKRSKKEIHKIFEDDNYMIFKPLTYASSCSYGYQTKWCTAMVNDPGYFYNHSRGILIYLIDKKENKKFAFYKHFPRSYEISDDHEQYVFKTYNQEDKQIDTIQTGLPMNILQIILMECDLKSPTTIPNYKLFSEDEKNEMRKHTGPLLDDEDLGGEEMYPTEELPLRNPDGFRLVPIVERLRRNARLIPMTDLEPRIEEINPHSYDGEDGMETIMEKETDLEDLKIRVDIVREELEKQIVEHILIHKSHNRES
jgi:hypothetical protein